MTEDDRPGSSAEMFPGARRPAQYQEPATPQAPRTQAPTPPEDAAHVVVAGGAVDGEYSALGRQFDAEPVVFGELGTGVGTAAARASGTPLLVGRVGYGRGAVGTKRWVESSAASRTVTAPLRPRPATWGWRGRLARSTGGLVKLAPDAAELAHRAAVATVRRATWTRAVSVIVTNPKGGVGKTPTALILAGILGQTRGGYVCAWEASESIGTLNRRAEGDPRRGIAELLDRAGDVRSAGHLGGYTAPQTSHADVIGSVGTRAVLTEDDVIDVRQVLDTYYRITLTDTGNNPGHEAYRAVLHTADAAVLPCLVSIDALAGLEEVLAVMRVAGGQVATPDGLLSRVVVILGHDGGPEDPDIATALRARLDELDVTVVEVPYDAAIRLGGEITLAALSEASTRAWTAAAAAVVTALECAPTDLDLVHELQATTARQG